MGKRYRGLKRGLYYLRNPNSIDTPVDPPAGSVLDNYKKFAGGETTLSYTIPDTSKKIALPEVKIQPFGLPATAEKARVKISQRVLNDANTLKTACNIEDLADADETAVRIYGFQPARAVVANLPDSPPAGTETSQITGLKYKPRGGVTYSLPFGQGGSNPTVKEVQTAILTQAKTTFGANTTVSFKPERI